MSMAKNLGWEERKGVKLGKRNSSPERGLENQEDKVWMRGAERERGCGLSVSHIPGKE